MSDSEVAALRDMRFSTARRGYDREEVDRYMNRVNQLLAELQITAAPEAAIKHALGQVRQETRSVIEDAEREAEEITRGSRARAEDRVQEATEEARKLREDAERQARELREAAVRETHGTRAAAETRIGELEDDVKAVVARRDRAVEELAELARSVGELLRAHGVDYPGGGTHSDGSSTGSGRPNLGAMRIASSPAGRDSISGRS